MSQDLNAHSTSSFGERFKDDMRSARLTQADIARIMGVAWSTVKRWADGSVPHRATLGRLAYCLGVTPEWLRNGTEPRLSAESRRAGEQVVRNLVLSNVITDEQGEATPSPSVFRHDVTWVPLVSWAHAGKAATYEELPAHWQDSIPTICQSPNAFALQIEGDSMEPRCEQGDVVIVMPGEEARNGCLAVAKLVDDGVVLRRYTKLANGQVRLIAYNTMYPTLDYESAAFHWIYPVHSTVRREWA